MSNTVLFVIDAFQIGGATAFLKQHTIVLQSLGYHVIILGATGNIDNPSAMFVGADIVVLPVTEGYGSLLGRWRWFVSTLRAIYDVYKRYNVVLLHSSLMCSYCVAMLHIRSWQIPRVYAFCGDVALETKSARLERMTRRFLFKNTLYYVLQYLVVLTSSQIVTFSNYAEALLIVRYRLVNKLKITVIPGFADYNPLKKSAHLNKKIRLLCVSRFEPRKGIGLLLKTVKLLENKGVKYNLKIAGAYTSTYFEYFFQQYESLNLFQNVHFIHKVDTNQLKTLFKDADVLIIPSLDYETFGMITLQALSYGVPVIGTPAGATVEILSAIDKRCLARSKSPQALADSICWISRISPQQRGILEKKISNVIKNTYSAKIIKRRIVSFYSSVLSNRE